MFTVYFHCPNGHIETVKADSYDEAIRQYCHIYNRHCPAKYQVHNESEIREAGIYILGIRAE